MVSVRPAKPVTHNFFSDFADAFSGFNFFHAKIGKKIVKISRKFLQKSMIPTKSFAQRIDGETGQAEPNGDFVVHFFIFSDKNRTFPTKKGIFLFEKFSHSIWRGEVPVLRKA